MRWRPAQNSDGMVCLEVVSLDVHTDAARHVDLCAPSNRISALQLSARHDGSVAREPRHGIVDSTEAFDIRINAASRCKRDSWSQQRRVTLNFSRSGISNQLDAICIGVAAA